VDSTATPFLTFRAPEKIGAKKLFRETHQGGREKFTFQQRKEKERFHDSLRKKSFHRDPSGTDFSTQVPIDGLCQVEKQVLKQLSHDGHLVVEWVFFHLRGTRDKSWF